jgi:hypothetical protein
MTAIEFEVRRGGELITNLDATDLKIRDYKGRTFGQICNLYSINNSYILACPHNIPVKDGACTFEFDLLEPPVPGSSDWHSLLIPPSEDAPSTGILGLGKDSLQAGREAGTNILNLIHTSYHRADTQWKLALQVLDAATSSSKGFDTTYMWGELEYRMKINLAEPVTSGPLTLKFANPVKHKVAFTAVPELRARALH